MSAWAVFAALATAGTPAAAVQDLEPVPTVQERTLAVQGRSVPVLCTPGVPAVVMLHDAGDGPASWRSVLERLPPGVAACAYDRTALAPRESRGIREIGWFELLEELLGVHRALSPRAGYVLVAQGEAATYARLLAASRRAPVGGLVLLEPSHESLPRRSRPGLPEEVWRSWLLDRAGPNEDGVSPAALAVRARASRLPAIPVTVVTAGLRPAEPGWDSRFLDEAARGAHEELVRGRRFGRHVPAPVSGPNLAEDAPALVADEILRVVRIADGR